MEIPWKAHGIPRKSYGNPIEIPWNPKEIPWKSHGNPMEILWNPMEIPWKSHGNPMESYGNPMEILANPSGAKAAQPRFKRKFLPRQIWPRKGSVHKCAPCTLVYTRECTQVCTVHTCVHFCTQVCTVHTCVHS